MGGECSTQGEKKNVCKHLALGTELNIIRES